MKLLFNFHGVLLFLLLVSVFSIHTSKAARPFDGSKQVEVKDDKFTLAGHLPEMESLMGMEECDDRDDECLKRRVMSEAHLDYIYTQHHNP